MGGNSATKDINKTIRVSLKQWERAVEAAQLETRRTGVKHFPTSLLGRVGTDGVDRIVARARRRRSV